MCARGDTHINIPFRGQCTILVTKNTAQACWDLDGISDAGGMECTPDSGQILCEVVMREVAEVQVF